MNTTNKIVLGVLMLALMGMSGVFITALSPIDNIVSDDNIDDTRDYITSDQANIIAINKVPGSIVESELKIRSGILVYEITIDQQGVFNEIVIDRKTGEIIAVETGNNERDENGKEEEDVPITGNALDQASNAVLTYMGEGKVTETEIGDEEGYYEIEITLDNGHEIDVHLDENFKVLSVEY